MAHLCQCHCAGAARSRSDCRRPAAALQQLRRRPAGCGNQRCPAPRLASPPLVGAQQPPGPRCAAPAHAGCEYCVAAGWRRGSAASVHSVETELRRCDDQSTLFASFISSAPAMKVHLALGSGGVPHARRQAAVAVLPVQAGDRHARGAGEAVQWRGQLARIVQQHRAVCIGAIGEQGRVTWHACSSRIPKNSRCAAFVKPSRVHCQQRPLAWCAGSSKVHDVCSSSQPLAQ